MCNIRTPRHNLCLPEGCLLAWEELLTHLTACSLSSKQSCLALNALDYRCIVQAEFGVNGVYQYVIIYCGVSSHGFRISISWLIIEGRLLDCSKLQASLQAWAKHFKHEQEKTQKTMQFQLCAAKAESEWDRGGWLRASLSDTLCQARCCWVRTSGRHGRMQGMCCMTGVNLSPSHTRLMKPSLAGWS